MIAVSVSELAFTLTKGVPPSTITGIGAGLLLLGYADRALVRAVRS